MVQSKSTNLQIGDTVCLKDGPTMRVAEIMPDSLIRCEWTDDKGNLRTLQTLPRSLVLVKEAGGAR
jgi:uncharacterized protein YodC (DUF2158 family)